MNSHNNKHIGIALIIFWIVFVTIMTAIGFIFFSHTGGRYWLTLLTSLLPSTIFMIISVTRLLKTD